MLNINQESAKGKDDTCMENLLEQKPYILLFGAGPGISELIHALNKDYEIEPFVYAEKRVSAIPGIIRFKYAKLKYPENKFYLLHTLLDFNDDIHIRQTTLLIPCTAIYEQFVTEFKDTLETSFIIISLNILRDALPTLQQKRR